MIWSSSQGGPFPLFDLGSVFEDALFGAMHPDPWFRV